MQEPGILIAQDKINIFLGLDIVPSEPYRYGRVFKLFFYYLRPQIQKWSEQSEPECNRIFGQNFGVYSM